jgi:hypothetical protein
MPKFRYVAVSPLRIEDKKRLGPAIYLHEFLVDHQTDAEGNVNYGKPFCYAWIRSKWRDAPPERSLRRHMARLRSLGYVWTTRARWDQGLRVRVLGSAKWPRQPAQMALFPLPEPVSISSGKAVEIDRVTGVMVRPKVADHPGQKWPRNEVKNLREEKNNGNPARYARSSPVEESEAVRARRQLLKEQLATLTAAKSSG